MYENTKKFNKAVRLMGCINHVCRICTVKSLSRLTCMTNKFNMINAFVSSVGKRNRQSHILPYFVLPTWAYIERTIRYKVDFINHLIKLLINCHIVSNLH